MSNESAGRVALLVDWENLAIPLMAKRQTVVDVQALTKLARRWGRLVDSRAYANWLDATHSDSVAVLTEQGFEPVFVRGKRSDGDAANAADIRIIVDMLTMAATRVVDTLILVSGDDDFVPAVQQARALGVVVVVVSLLESASPRYHYLADHFISYEWITRGGPAPIVDEMDALQSGELLLQWIGKFDFKGRRYSAPAVKQLLALEYGEFEEEELGFASFRQVLCVAERRGLVKVDFGVRGGQAWIYGPDEQQAIDGRRLPEDFEWSVLVAGYRDVVGQNATAFRAMKPRLLEDLQKHEAGYTERRLDQLLAAARHQNVVLSDARPWVDGSGNRVGGSRATRWVLNIGHPRVQAYLSE